MSASNDDGPRNPFAWPMLSASIADLTTPGVVVKMDAAEAESLGAFEETALTEAEAWDPNANLDPEDEEGDRWQLTMLTRSPARSSSSSRGRHGAVGKALGTR